MQMSSEQLQGRQYKKTRFVPSETLTGCLKVVQKCHFFKVSIK